MNKEQIVYGLINTLHNRELLEDVPHREFHDLSIVYYEVKIEDDIPCIFLISNQQAKVEGLSEEELYELAKKNTPEISLPHVQSIAEFIEEIGYSKKIEATELPDNVRYFISNVRHKHGAIAILYENVLDELAQKVGTDLYLLPSSVHEFVAVSVEGEDLDKLEEQVHYVNITRVEFNERLSNQIYHYNKDTKEITQATHSQYAALDSVRDKWFDEPNGMTSSEGGLQMGM